jgi:hypothetical protein
VRLHAVITSAGALAVNEAFRDNVRPLPRTVSNSVLGTVTAAAVGIASRTRSGSFDSAGMASISISKTPAYPDPKRKQIKEGR